MWLLWVLVAASTATAPDTASQRAVQSTYTWHMYMNEGKKVSGFLTVSSAAVSLLEADLHIKSGEASLFISTNITGTAYKWTSDHPGDDFLALRRSDSLMASDSLGLVRRFEIGALGQAPGRTRVCLTLTLTEDYATGGSLRDAVVLFSGFSEEEEEGSLWPVVAVVAVAAFAVCAWRSKRGQDLKDLRTRLL